MIATDSLIMCHPVTTLTFRKVQSTNGICYCFVPLHLSNCKIHPYSKVLTIGGSQSKKFIGTRICICYTSSGDCGGGSGGVFSYSKVQRDSSLVPRLMRPPSNRRQIKYGSDCGAALTCIPYPHVFFSMSICGVDTIRVPLPTYQR